MSAKIPEFGEAMDDLEVGEGLREMRADARRNRDLILVAARDVFVEQGVEAPLDDIAKRAGVGIATLYRRFPDRRSLIEAVTLDILRQTADEARLALSEEPDAFRALARYMHRALDLRVGAIMPVLVASPTETKSPEYLQSRNESAKAVREMIDRAQADGLLRTDIAEGDIGMLIIRLNRPLPGAHPRDLDDRLSHRHLDLLIDGLRQIPGPAEGTLSGPALTVMNLRELSTQPASADPRRNTKNRQKE